MSEKQEGIDLVSKEVGIDSAGAREHNQFHSPKLQVQRSEGVLRFLFSFLFSEGAVVSKVARKLSNIESLGN